MPPKKGMKSKTHKGDLDYTTKRGDKDYHRGGHDEKEKKKPFSKKKSKSSKPKTEVIKLRKSEGADENANIKIKEGALHRQLKVGADYTFKKSEMNKLDKIEVGSEFDFHGKHFKMTPLMKKRVSLAHTMMGWKK